jgi:hypothetical protein
MEYKNKINSVIYLKHLFTRQKVLLISRGNASKSLNLRILDILNRGR